MEATQQDESAPPRRAWLPWGLLAGAMVLGGTGAWAGSRSVSALVERGEQLEREAAESEARVAELQALREAMARRLRVLEQQHQEAQQAALTATTACAITDGAATLVAPEPAPRAVGKAARGKKSGRR
ncbi:hypothetical protein LZ198_40545 [Myxococcus sp. K15C18031901]|uniref:hypothetical protein n=1 Tax=Myxococcus dinghuensis TaxID=2906761 RepID=UPI0020A7C873|nr:hypothetical protein [Myxococcus dinghuensis]MCP3105177.1 hypothetical protein [Myxococcus dinghuensis]